MKKVKIVFLLALVMISLVGGGVALCARFAINNKASFGFFSASGGYRIEYVRIDPPFPFYNLAYMRVIDLTHSDQVFRSPVADAESLEMRAIETRDEVGVSFLRFNKVQHRFNVLIPGWEESFLNIFVSNTPYDVSADE
jgi:hypothetical protein